MNKTRALVGLGAVAAVVVGLMFVPLPYYVACTFEIQPAGARSVYVDVPGELKAVYVRGGSIREGDLIAELDDLDARLAEQRLVGQCEELAVKIESIRQRAHTDDQALLELSQAEEARAALEAQLTRLRQDLAKLTIRAPAGGIVVPAPSRAEEPSSRVRLASWSGRPLAAKNVGAYLEASTLVCRIAQPGQLEAILAIDQAELDFVRSGQPVELLLVQSPGEKLTGVIDRIAEENMQAAPTRLAARTGGQLATQADAGGIERPLSVIYQASVPVQDSSGQIVVGATGLAKIRTGYQPLWQRLYRSACRTFHFEM